MNKEVGNVVIVSATNSFLAKSVSTKLKEEHIDIEMISASIGEIEARVETTALIVLFLSDELLVKKDTVAYLHTKIVEHKLGLIMIGDDMQYKELEDLLPRYDITEWFQRPLAIDKLVEKVCAFIEEKAGENRRKTVMIVDDDETYMRTVYEWLKEDYDVCMAANGVQAISHLARTQVDLVLLDYEMPIADGPQVLAMMKSYAATGHIPVMFLSGHSERETVLSAIDLHPVDYLLKKTINGRSLRWKLETFFEKLEEE